MGLSATVGQERLVKELLETAKRGAVANTYMFVGPEGCGKIALALSFVKSIVQSQRNIEVKDLHASLNKIETLNHPDLHFSFPVTTSDKVKKDPVSKDYISEWREMISRSCYFNLNDWYKKIGAGNKQGIISAKEAESISKTMALKSYEGGYKFMIIWMAEKMNESAANKLLKLLEEPPKKTVFILLCENEKAILNTIKSRCQKISVPPIQAQDISSGLQLAKKLSAELANKIGESSAGNYRIAIQKAENEEVTPESGEDFAGWVRLAFKVKNSKQAVSELVSYSENIAKKSREDQKAFLKDSLAIFRKSLLYNYAVDSSDIEFGEGFHLAKFAPYVHENNISEIYDELQLAYNNIERNGNSKIVFLDTSIKLTRLLHIKPSAKNE